MEQRAASTSSGSSSAAPNATTVKNAGVGMRPDSILRNVSTDTPDAAATSTMLRLAAVRDHASAGVRLDELDDVARSVIDGARPSFLDYHPNWAPRPFPTLSAPASATPLSTASLPVDASSKATW